jgi:predicted  nucleic acid-binding Zn-ribbon protein
MATLRGVGTMRASCVRRFEAGHTRENARATSAGCAARARPSGASERRRRRARRLSVRATDAGRTRADVVDDRSSTRMRSRAVGADAGAVAEKSNGKVYADARWMSEVRQGGMFGMVLMFAMGFGAQYAPWKPWKTMRGAAAVQTSAVASVEDAQTAATLAAFELGLEIGDRDGKKYSEGVVESDAMSEEALEVENASGREKSGGTLTTAFVGGSVIAAAIFAYYERYAIVASVYKALSMLTEVDPKFVSPFDELKRANLEHDSKTDALSAEWAERLQAEKTKSRASASEFERRIESDRAEFEELERALRELISAKDTEISNLVGQLADLKRAYEEERLVSENASAASKDANEQLARSRQALEEAEENKRELSNEMESIKREIVNARDECASLQSALEASRGEHSDASGVVAELEEKLETALSSEESLKRELTAVSEERDSVRSALEMSKSEHEGVSGDVAALKEKLETALSSEESLKRELTAVSEERDSVRSALEMSKSEHSDASDLVAELNERVAALQIEIDEKVALIEDSKRSYAGELAEAKSKNDELSSELTKVKSQAADAMANFAHLDSVVTDIVSTVNELRRLSHMVTEESPIFEHEFVVQDVPALGDGEFVVIVGSWNSWDAQQGDVMTYDAENDVHKGFVQLQTDVVYEYKYCVCTSDGDVRHERLWQTGANSAFCVASSLMEDHDLVQKATLQSKWQPDPANAPISLYRSNGECLTMGATKLMTDLPTSLIADAIDQLSNIITKTEAVVENKNVGSPR